MDQHTWDTVERLTAWLDAAPAGHPAAGPGSGSSDPAKGDSTALLRIMKLSEEVGEVAQAVIGATGSNPRKGDSHTWDDVRSELCDVVVTAMVALRTLTPDAREVFSSHLERVSERSLTAAAAPDTERTSGSGVSRSGRDPSG